MLDRTDEDGAFSYSYFSYKATAFQQSEWVSLHNGTIWDSVMTEHHDRQPKVECLAQPLA
jgi:hypothetical protein